jgi:hypothetical protein
VEAFIEVKQADGLKLAENLPHERSFEIRSPKLLPELLKNEHSEILTATQIDRGDRDKVNFP